MSARGGGRVRRSLSYSAVAMEADDGKPGPAAARHDLDLVCRVLDRLAAAGAPCLLAGGWGEELLGLWPAGPHGDIDLLLPAPSFAAVDAMLTGAAPGAAEIAAKRFAHKRAFRHGDVMVEVTLVERGPGGPVTRFWGDVPFRWLTPLACRVGLPERGRAIEVLTAANLAHYRAHHRETRPWRWQDPAMRIARPGE